MSLFYNQTARILRPAVRTSRSDEQQLDYRGLRDAPGVPWNSIRIRPLQQGLALEDGRRTDTQTWWIASLPGSGDVDLLATDWLRLPDGEIVAVASAIARPSDPFTGKLHHVEVRVELVKG